VCFVLVEGYWASYPLMPLRLLLQRNMLSACIANLVGALKIMVHISTSRLSHDVDRQRGRLLDGKSLRAGCIVVKTDCGSRYITYRWYVRLRHAR
jgi:hypothetical protein